MHTTRASLLLRIRNREDSAAWETFDGIYRPMLQRFAVARGLSVDAADEIAQQCMTAIHQHIDGFEYDPEKGRFKAWLRTMAGNKIRNMLRDRRDVQAESAQIHGLSSDGESPDEVFDKLWMQQHLWHCLRQLEKQVEPETYQAYIHYVIDQWPVEKVCQTLGLSPNNVYTIKWRMTEKVANLMRELLDGDENGEA